jgi:hypothetical protein
MNHRASLSAALLALLFAGHVLAKLPPPSEEAKTKAAEAAAKAAHAGKVGAFLLCKSQDRTAAAYLAGLKKAGKPAPPATATPPCADPGAFVYAPAAPAVAAAPQPAAPKK